MKNRRVIRGNFTTLPTGSDVLSANLTNAVTENEHPLKPGKTVFSSPECVREARFFSEENEK